METMTIVLWCLAEQVRKMATSKPITIMTRNSKKNGSLASFALPVPALGAQWAMVTYGEKVYHLYISCMSPKKIC